MWAIRVLLVLLVGCSDPTPYYNIAINRPTGPKRIFLTRVAITGSEVSDEICQRAAEIEHLGGSWIAWIATADTTRLNPIDRISDIGPWYDLEGDLIFLNKEEMLSFPRRPIVVTEYNASVISVGYVWTGSNGKDVCFDGLSSKVWGTSSSTAFGSVGEVGSTTLRWTDSTRLPCNRSAHLICIEQ